jgi:hypothetical protein
LFGTGGSGGFFGGEGGGTSAAAGIVVDGIAGWGGLGIGTGCSGGDAGGDGIIELSESETTEETDAKSLELSRFLRNVNPALIEFINMVWGSSLTTSEGASVVSSDTEPFIAPRGGGGEGGGGAGGGSGGGGGAGGGSGTFVAVACCDAPWPLCKADDVGGIATGAELPGFGGIGLPSAKAWRAFAFHSL